MGSESGRQWLTAGLLLACLALTLWVRLLPLSLPQTEVLAERLVRFEHYERFYSEIGEALPVVERQDEARRRLADWVAANPEIYAQERAAAAARFRSEYSFQAADGREHVYLGDADSYYWLRFARNLFRQGHVCDSGAGDSCRDGLAHAPQGNALLYPHSLHIYAIAAVQWVADRVAPGFPLTTSAYLVPVVVGLAGVLPAFFIGLRLAGLLGAVATALTTALHPVFLTRSLGADNDVWNLVLPLFMAWAVLTALSSKGRFRALGLAALAGAFAGLHATVWQGWLFGFTVLLLALIGYLVTESLRFAIAHGSLRLSSVPELRRGALVTLAFYVSAAVFSSLAGAGDAVLTGPFEAVRSVAGPLLTSETEDTVAGLPWPNVLDTVSELIRPNLVTLAESLGGLQLLLAALVGLLLMFFPRGFWGWRHFLCLFSGIALYVVVLRTGGLGDYVVLFLIALPPFCALALNLFEQKSPDPRFFGALLITLWFLAAVHLSFGGIRFVFFLSLPFGLALGVGLGRLYAWGATLIDGQLTKFQTPARAAVFLLLGLVLIFPVSRGYEAAQRYLPQINDAWWDSLTDIRQDAAPDSIVTSWWDFGHWIKYAADRPVTLDGASLKTHLPHWVGRALAALSESESLAVLRLLNCGSEALPLPEGRDGAFGKVVALGRDEAESYGIVSGLLQRDAGAAKEFLAAEGLTAAQQADVLASSHCQPPESYLVLTSVMARKVGSWFHLGLWDGRRAEVTQRLADLPAEEALKDMTGRLGYGRREAEVLLATAQRIETRQQAEAFIAPKGALYTFEFQDCLAEAYGTAFDCPVILQLTPTEGLSGRFRFDPASPMDAELIARGANGAEFSSAPGLLLLAGATELQGISFGASSLPQVAVLADLPNRRVLVGTPEVISSTFVHLLYLDGRYARHYEKVSERQSSRGERVSVWKVKW